MPVKTGRIFTGDIGMVNQILPHCHKWAWELYLKGQANFWLPSKIPMGKDIEQWKSRALSDDERLLVKRCLGFFAGSESLVANNLLLGIFRVVSDAECRQYISNQQKEEAVHNHTIVYICDSLGLDIDEVYQAYQTIPSIKAKDDFLLDIITDMGRPGFDVTTMEGKKEALRNIITFYILCEGIFFYSGFAMLLSFGRQNKLSGLCEQVNYTLRDEGLHVEFGTKLINLIVEQEPEIWTDDFKEEIIEYVKRATELEVAYAKDVLPRGVFGLSSDLFVAYMQYLGNLRLSSLGLKSVFKRTRNPFPWLSETIELKKEKNFFETHVIEYAVGQLLDDL